jgi:hypothetical protein
MAEDDPDGKELWEKLQKHLKRGEAWDRAAEEHLTHVPDSDIDLATREKVWRELERSHPDWRELWKKAERDIQRLVQLKTEPERIEETGRIFERMRAEGVDIVEELKFQNRLKIAAALDQRINKARLEQDHIFLRRFAKAVSLPDGVTRQPRTAKGFVLVAWCELGGLKFNGPFPTKHRIRLWVDTRKSFDDKTWDRTWEDPFIAALLRAANS